MAAGLREETLLAGYLFYGEEEYLAEEFVAELKEVLAASAGGEVRLTRMDLDETKWRDIVDAARTAPFLFDPWRAIVVRVPEKKSASQRTPGRGGGGDGEEGRASCYLGPADQKILGDYFADPPARTVLVVIRAGKVRKDDALVRFFAQLSAADLHRMGPSIIERRDGRDRSVESTHPRRTRGARFSLPAPHPRGLTLARAPCSSSSGTRGWGR